MQDQTGDATITRKPALPEVIASFTRAIIKEIDLVALVSETVRLEKVDSVYWAVRGCPFCGSGSRSHRRSLYVIGINGSWGCHDCQKHGGDALTWIMETRSVDSNSALDILCERILPNDRFRLRDHWQRICPVDIKEN